MRKTPSEAAPSFIEYLESLDQDAVREHQEALLIRATKEHAEFGAAFEQDRCYICSKPLATFSSGHPCLHWLLRPKGFRKKHFKDVSKTFGFLQMQSYLRWVASTDAPFQNVNDLLEEGTGKFIECTIRYKHIEWSFSCGRSDLRGHASSSHSSHPHYHFQMRLDGRSFIDFGDFHPAMTHADALQIEAMHSRPDLIRAAFPFGESIRDLLSNEQAIVKAISSPGATHSDTSSSPLRVESLIVADEGTQISGQALYEVIEEARATGVTVASLLHKIPSASAQVIVSPSEGVVSQAPRKGSGGK